MIIIDSKKDYYDYLVGINGRDEGVVYDRRDSIKIIDSYKLDYDSSSSFSTDYVYGLFSTKPSKHDVMRTKNNKRRSKFFVKHYGLKNEDEGEHGRLYFCIMEIGLKQYVIVLDRYLTNDGDKVILEPLIKEIKEIKIEDKKNRPVVGIYTCHSSFGGSDFTLGENIFREWCDRKWNTKELLFNGTWVTGLISPEEIYNEIYNYIIATKDKKIEDNRSDVEKAQSHGFNSESFRNPIRVKDLGEKYKKDK